MEQRFSTDNPDQGWLAPWTPELFEAFEQRFGYSLVDRLPELFLRVDGRAVSPVKWHYAKLTQQLFLENFLAPLHRWCAEHGLSLTGHVLHEDSLTAQTVMQGSLMRSYEYMHVPGIDLLTEGNRRYWVAKQLQSVARQLRQPWRLSELYGCTGWQFDFRSHKEVGDWQTLFGINVRCHHLSWYTMGGEAKRDYPASISFQSAWFRQYRHVETYFARLGTVLDAGAACCDVLVLNPIESVWCQTYAGWSRGLSPTGEPIRELERRYAELFHWLAGAQVDFDYADEEHLGRLGSVDADAADGPLLRVGQADYRCVVVGGMTTIRASSLALLRRFLAAGGRVVFVGDLPAYVDAAPSADAAAAAQNAACVPWEREALLDAIRPALRHAVRIVGPNGEAVPDAFCQLRRDGSRTALVVMNVNRTTRLDDLSVSIDGVAGAVEEWDLMLGTRRPHAAEQADGPALTFRTSLAESETRVFVVDASAAAAPVALPRPTAPAVPLDGPYRYTLDEPNVCVLDVARWCLGDGRWREPQEVLKIDRAVRDALGLARRSGEMVQPWFRHKFAAGPERAGVLLTLRFRFDVEALPADGTCHLCIEQASRWRVRINGRSLAGRAPNGWWIDPAFQRLPLTVGDLRVGQNEIEIECLFVEDVDVEAIYLTGPFGVRLDGRTPVVGRLPAKLDAGTITSQGLPFYSGGITYALPVPSGTGGELTVDVFGGACVMIGDRDEASALIAWPPYRADVSSDQIVDGTLAATVILTRRNTFGPLHELPLAAAAYGPANFVTDGERWTDDYQLWPAGLLAPPRFAAYEA